MLDDDAPRSFSRIIHLLGDGECHGQLTEELYALGKALREQSAAGRKVKGQLKLTLSVEATPEGVVTIAYEIDAKQPKPRRPGTVMWLTKSGNFTDENPHQRELFGVRDIADVARPERRDV